MDETHRMFKRIVVGWNGTSESEVALDWALRRGPEAPILIVHAVEPHSRFNEERVRVVLDRQTPARRWDVETRVAEGDPEAVLGALLQPGSLVVVGTPASKHGSRWSLGARLAGRHGGGAVAVVPAGPGDHRSTVVVGVDGSLASLVAVDVAATEALRRGAPLEIVHAWHPPATWTPVFGEVVADLEIFESMHRKVLDDALEHARRPGLDCIGRLERSDPAQLLAEAGRTAALVVIAGHGYGPVRRFFLGSVSVVLLLDPPCPVVVVTEGPAAER